MKKENLEKIQEKLELITRKWWFLFFFILCGTMVPPIVTKGFDPSKIGEIIQHILRSALITGLHPWVLPVFKIIPIILVFALILFGNRISRIFSLYAGITLSSFCPSSRYSNN